jgi:hypothetical protein
MTARSKATEWHPTPALPEAREGEGLTTLPIQPYLAAAIIAWICATASFVRNSK